MQTSTYNSLLQLPCRPLLQVVVAASMQTLIYSSFLQLPCIPTKLGARMYQFFSKRGRPILDAISIPFGWIGYKCHILNRTGVAIASFWLSLPLAEQQIINSIYFFVKMLPAYAGSTLLDVDPPYLEPQWLLLSPSSDPIPSTCSPGCSTIIAFSPRTCAKSAN